MWWAQTSSDTSLSLGFLFCVMGRMLFPFKLVLRLVLRHEVIDDTCLAQPSLISIKMITMIASEGSGEPSGVRFLAGQWDEQNIVIIPRKAWYL